AGCGKREPEENQAAAHLRTIARAYDLANYKRHRPPRNMEEMKASLQEMMGEGQDVEAVLRSPNDGEPDEVVWGINLERETNGGLLLAYERKGVDGKRYAINVSRVVKQLSDEEINNGSAPRGRRPTGG